MKMSKKAIAIFIFIVVFCVILFFPYLKAEYFTFQYGEEFLGLEQHTKMMSPASYHKVISYSSDNATVFYVLSGKGGCVINFTKDDSNMWQLKNWTMIWSHYGSADNFYWPYYK